jgi:hypothetical protein
MKDKKKQNFLFGCLIAISLFVILIVVMANIKVTPLKVYTDPQFKFSLKYPAYWKMVPRPEKGLALVQFFAPKSSESDEIFENVNIVLVDLSTKPKMMDLNFFTDVTTKQLLGVFGDYVNVLESKQIRMSGMPAYRILYITKTESGLTQSKIKYLHAWMIKGRAAFILTYVGDQEGFDASLKHVDRMIRTFKFEE